MALSQFLYIHFWLLSFYSLSLSRPSSLCSGNGKLSIEETQRNAFGGIYCCVKSIYIKACGSHLFLGKLNCSRLKTHPVIECYMLTLVFLLLSSGLHMLQLWCSTTRDVCSPAGGSVIFYSGVLCLGLCVYFFLHFK